MELDVTRADRVCRLFCGVIEQVITPRAMANISTDELSRSQFNGLQFIYLHPQCCIKDLANGLCVSHPAAVKLVERLESKNLVTRRACEVDRRVVQLLATEAGEEQARESIGARGQAIMQILQVTCTRDSCDIIGCLEAFVREALDSQKTLDGVCLHCGGSHDDDCPVCQAELELTGQLRRDG